MQMGHQIIEISLKSYRDPSILGKRSLADKLFMAIFVLFLFMHFFNRILTEERKSSL